MGDKEINVFSCCLKVVIGVAGYQPRERPEEQR